MQFRDLPEEKQFPKWSEIELEVTDSSSDNRPETLRPIESSIEVVRRIGTSANGLNVCNSWIRCSSTRCAT